MGLHGKRVLITGAAGGLGSATMAALTASGCSVIGIDRTPGVGAAADRVIVADLRNPSEVSDAVAEAVGRLGGLDILINNAAVLDLQDPGAAPVNDSIEHFDVNLFGAWRTTAAALPALLEARGRVINVSSLFAVVNAVFIPAYSASKRAMVAYSDVLRMQYGDRIGVTTVYPGYMGTPIHDKIARQGLSVARLVTFKIGGRTLLSLEEPLDAAARTMVRLCRGRVRRDCGLTFFGSLSLLTARHAPRFVDGFIRWRVGRLVRHGILSISLESKT
ncbi:MAG: short-chain dehydrogenase [Tardiphaga sp.]|uniref:SDR family NAD(P)-dependent oxidoreductase n=1 Tax=Tardiphaga sp. TaxID=1926292 RepID=UPI002629913F|nr:SDR family oxidoreductase [Tardiphaga sp.]MDB5502872.1 short-chain dehydrogenase [Tardiphaga sp.]